MTKKYKGSKEIPIEIEAREGVARQATLCEPAIARSFTPAIGFCINRSVTTI
ncbi:hypothetical protein [Pseudobacteriovorax antillogorgiicola]|uniref:hypothetical protein n=1 Tax=Pseudobacteriovorax antillogorgiicola TaxID=1513793 RepID=UPI0013562B4B|nr:hypothetical protein [Pseudobacteriovorax antillogorgiicola]